MVGGSNSSQDGSLLVVICKTFTSVVGTSTLGNLEDDRSLDVSAELEVSIS
jgi:hypothetical protein